MRKNTRSQQLIHANQRDRAAALYWQFKALCAQPHPPVQGLDMIQDYFRREYRLGQKQSKERP